MLVSLLREAIPKNIMGGRSCNTKDLPGDGVRETEASGVKMYPSRGIGAPSPVLHITLDVTADPRQLGSNLMLAPSMEHDLKEMIPLRMAQEPEVEDRPFCTLDRIIESKRFSRPFIDPYVMYESS